MSTTITLSFATVAEAAAALARLTGSAITPAEASLKHTPATPGASSTAVDDQTKAEPEKPKASAKDNPAAAPAPAATQPSADTAKTAAPAGDAVDYATLSKSVLSLMKLSPTAPGEIAKALGFDTFKLMKEAENAADLFKRALPLVQAKIAELEAV